MRGSAQSFSGWPVQAARRAAWQGEILSPVHPLQTNKCSWIKPPDNGRPGHQCAIGFRPYRWGPE